MPVFWLKTFLRRFYHTPRLKPHSFKTAHFIPSIHDVITEFDSIYFKSWQFGGGGGGGERYENRWWTGDVARSLSTYPCTHFKTIAQPVGWVTNFNVFGFLQTVSQTLRPHHTRSDTFFNSHFCVNGLTTHGDFLEQILQDRSKILTFSTPTTTR
jgi:hypothetical protein